jgi:hypothetical protein
MHGVQTMDGLGLIGRILEHFENVKEQSGGQWSARCPVHDDQTNSLCISVGDDGKALFDCKAGCATEDVISAVGLTWGDCFPQNGQSNGHASNGRKHIVEVYKYLDETFTCLFQVCRYEPKEFRQRRPKDGGGFDWSTKGVRKVLYRLPQLESAKAADPNRAPVVFVPEGEKDADNLAKLGLTTTCNAGGAAAKGSKSKWLATYSDSLCGCRVVILPDNDEPGRAHAQTVAKSLHTKAASIKIIELPGLPEKGDVSDWLAAGGMVEQLQALVTAAPEWEPSTEEQAARPEDSDSISNADDDAPLTMAKIITRIQAATGAWPRRVDGELFVCDGSGISWIPEVSALFGWLHARTGKPIPWHNKRIGLITKNELYAELKRTSQKYIAVEELPHEPQLAGHFYTTEAPPAGDGSTVAALLDRFSPQTQIDRDLLLAALATPLWGGGGGQRPAFVITAEAGRGIGKSKVAHIIGHVYGGFLDFSPKDEMREIKQRLLSPEGLVRRVALLDNVKSLRFSWSELESLITSPSISGKRMYVGEGTRPNVLTWFITLNGAALSTDMAQRSVIIKLSIPQRSGTWEAETTAFAIENRQKIFGDLIGFLRQPPAALASFSRWATWEQAILSRLPEPNEAQAVILERQAVVDVEAEDSAIFEDYIEEQLRRLEYDTDTDTVHISVEVATRWFNWANHEKHRPGAVTRMMKQLIEENRTKNLRLNPCKTYGRGFQWVGKNADFTTTVKYDLEARLARRKAENETES